MNKIYDKETPPKDIIWDCINMAYKVDRCMRAQSAQKVILANSTSLRSDSENHFHLQPSPHYNSTNALQTMNNQVVDMDIDALQKWNTICQKHTYDGKPTATCFN